jgi:methionine synthase I (cobalamin-dependent)
MAEKSKVLLDLGVKILGGCCGTTPEHTAALKRVASGARERAG